MLVMFFHLLTALTFLYILFLAGREIYNQYKPFPCALAGTNVYMKSDVKKLRHPETLHYVDRKYAAFVEAFENSPTEDASHPSPIQWKKGDHLIINQAFDKFIKNRFYVLHKDNEYRVVQCLCCSMGMPPIFNGHETLITHDCIGEVIGVWSHGNHKYIFGNTLN